MNHTTLILADVPIGPPPIKKRDALDWVIVTLAVVLFAAVMFRLAKRVRDHKL